MKFTINITPSSQILIIIQLLMGSFCSGQESQNRVIHCLDYLPNLNAYFDEDVIYNEQPFPVKGKQLKELIHRSIGALTFLDKNGKTHAGSATLISKSIVLTAAHNIYSKQHQSANRQFKFYLGADGIGERYYEIEQWRYPQEFQTCQASSKLPYDYAIMKLKQQIVFDEYLPISQACTQCIEKNKNNITLKIYGFPRAYNNFKALDNQGNKITLYQYGLTRPGRIVQINRQQQKICYGISTRSGQSGCPVVAENMIIAVHVGVSLNNSNMGRIIDHIVLKKLIIWGKQLGLQQYQVQKKKLCDHQNMVLRSKRIKQYNQQDLFVIYSSDNIEAVQYFNQEDVVDLSECANILDLNLAFRKQKNIDISHCTYLQKLNLLNNRLRQINLSKNINLVRLCLDDNQLQNIDISANINLTQFTAVQNNLSKVDVNANIHLTHLILATNKIEKIDLSLNIHLIQLFLSSNKLQEINLDSNINLTYFFASQNNLKKIDMSTNINLTNIVLSNNKLTQINLRHLTNLKQLILNNNKLSFINLFIAENVEEETYIKTYDFNLTNQQASVCRVQLNCKESTKQKAANISELWRQQYRFSSSPAKINELNRYKCKYNFEVV